MTDERKAEFLALLEPVYHRLSRYALAVTRNEMDAEDLVSATVLRAFEQFDRVKQGDRFLPYLTKIASRLHKRRRYRERNHSSYNETVAFTLPDRSPLPEHAAEIRIVMDALQTLPDRVRETVVMFDVADLSLEEIREIQGGTISGVKSRLRRGRELLSRTLGLAPNRRRTDRSAMRKTPKLDPTKFLLLTQET